MKTLNSFLALSLIGSAAVAADYTVFRVCEDKHVIRTSDGVEAGRVEYIAIDPASQRIVTTVLTGGALGDRLVSIPISSFRFGAEQEITLTEINRERLVSAPVIERSQITASMVIQPAVIEKSFTHFGARLDTAGVSGTSSTATTSQPGSAAPPPSGTTTQSTTGRSTGAAQTPAPGDPPPIAEGPSDSKSRAPRSVPEQNQPSQKQGAPPSSEQSRSSETGGTKRNERQGPAAQSEATPSAAQPAATPSPNSREKRESRESAGGPEKSESGTSRPQSTPPNSREERRGTDTPPQSDRSSETRKSEPGQRPQPE